MPEKSESEKAPAKAEEKPKKPNYFQQLWDKDGVIGYLLLISNLVETASSAVTTLFRGFHIYSLYVKMIVGGADAADIAEKYGTLCSFYYPVKGMILNGMKVDQYDDYIQPDFIAPPLGVRVPAHRQSQRRSFWCVCSCGPVSSF